MLAAPSRRGTGSPLILAFGLALVCAPAPAAAQGGDPTRSELIAEQQRAKAETGTAYVPSRAELVFQQIEEGRLFGPRNGPYPALGSVYPGGGLGLGGGFRRLVGDRSRFDVRGLFSIAGFKRVEATFHSPGHARRRLDVGLRAGWLDAPRVSYFGLGPDSPRSDHASFGLEERYAEAELTWTANRRVRLGAAGGYESYRDRAGAGPHPSIGEQFAAGTVPRFGETPSFARGSGSVTLLWTDTPAYGRRGGFLRFAYNGYQRLDQEGEFGYTRTELVQHIPIRRETWVVSLRARSDVLIGDDADAPYFMFPSLGSGTTLRGYETNRFRDRHALLFSGEWRWIPNHFALDLAVFADAGTVGPRWRDLDVGRLHADAGIGLRVHTQSATVLRIEVARGREGTRLVFTASAPF